MLNTSFVALFDTAIASGITAFEGGGIGYNLPYCKDVPLDHSLKCWREIDAQCGFLAQRGIVVDREFFGTLTGVLMPPSICLVMILLEALLAVREGVCSLSMAYCQGGHIVQDVAALKAIPILAQTYLPKNVWVFPVFHQFMGAFPQERSRAEALIFWGGLTAKKGGAVKVINKTYEEAFGVPAAEANNAGIWTTRMTGDPLFDFIEIPAEDVEEELDQILREVHEMLDPVLEGSDLCTSICDAFAAGRLDVPFSASRYARSEVIPMRDAAGAIRFYRYGRLPVSDQTKRKNRISVQNQTAIFEKLKEDIFYFCRQPKREGSYENLLIKQ